MRFPKGQELLELTKLSVDLAADAIFLVDREGCFIYVNNAAVQILGYGRNELLGLNVSSIDPHYNQSNWPYHWKKVKKAGKVTFESIHITKHGEKIPVEIMVSHLELHENEYHCAIVRNISERKKTEEILKQNEHRLRKTLDVTSDGVWDRNLQSGEVYYGAKWATILGYKPEDLQNGSIQWDALLHPDDRDKAVQAVKDHLAGITSHYEAEFRLCNKDGKYQWIHARGEIIEYDTEGKPVRFVGTHTDITWRKKLEASILKKSEETKFFAYSVVHDLKNPSIVIKGLADRFRQKLPQLSEDKMLLYCNKMVDSSNQIAQLVDRINSFIIAKESRLKLEDIPVREIIRSSRNEFVAQLQYRSIEWRVFKDNPIIRMDRLAILRVLRNFIENSLKYGGDKLTRISFGYQDTPGFHVLSVRDNGAGMNLEDCNAIFKPFERKGSVLDQKGAGLGLAIVKEIAHHHKGDVWLEPNQKRGVQFCFAISKNL